MNMKITVNQLRRIIKEEVSRVINEMPRGRVLTPVDAFSKLEAMAPNGPDGVVLKPTDLIDMGITPKILDGVMNLAVQNDIYWMSFGQDGSVTLYDPMSQ